MDTKVRLTPITPITVRVFTVRVFTVRVFTVRIFIFDGLSHKNPNSET